LITIQILAFDRTRAHDLFSQCAELSFPAQVESKVLHSAEQPPLFPRYSTEKG